MTCFFWSCDCGPDIGCCARCRSSATKTIPKQTGWQQTFVYDRYGNRNFDEANTTTLTWDTQGRMTKIKDANNKETNFGYDNRARVTSVTNALDQTTNVEYDLHNRLKKIIYPDTNFVTYTYDLAGRRTGVTDPLNHTATYGYDPAYRLTSITDALNHSTAYGYDLMSNLTAVTEALGNTTNLEYDAFDRLKKVKYPAATIGAMRLEESFTYDLVGNVKTKVDTAGRTTNYDYDNANRLIKITDALTQLTQFEYNARSQMTKVKDALNQEYTFTYDPLGRQLTQSRAGSTMTFEYDAVGNRTKRTDYIGRVSNYAFDNLNRLTQISYASGATSKQYAYDDLSRLISAVNEAGTVSFTYDNRGRLKTEADVFGHVTERFYDAANRRTELRLDGASYATYAYDIADRLTGITNISDSTTIGFGYDNTNRITSRTYPNGVTTTYEYDGMSRLTRLRDGTLFDRQYSYNSTNQISQIVEPTLSRVFGYDDIDRLTSVTGSVSENYAFDPVGNRKSSHRSSSYTYQPFNKLAATQTASYQYDANGNTQLKSDAAGYWIYGWDNENRMVSARKQNKIVRYQYDALGRRVSRIGKTLGSTKYTYDGEDVVMDEDFFNGVVKYQNGPGIDNKLRAQAGSDAKYFIADHLGSTNGLTDSTGAMTASTGYDSFGNATNSSFANRYQFTGREFDNFTGLHYYRARWYDGNLGRFVSEDPIGLAGGINQYSYVSNNPGNKNDPLGLYETDVHYYLTYYLASKTGCFSDPQARAIANGNQLTDEDAQYAPDLGRTHANSTYHALNDQAAPGVPSVLLGSQATPHNYIAAGRSLHYLQDTFSHAGYTNSYYGHAGALHYYDKTDSDPERAMRMAGATWGALKDFAKTSGCKCEPKWTPDVQQTVVQFVRTSGANIGALNTIDSTGGLSDFGITNPSAYLGRKIRILGVDPRR